MLKTTLPRSVLRTQTQTQKKIQVLVIQKHRSKKLTQSRNKTKHTQPHALHTKTGNTNRNANPEKK